MVATSLENGRASDAGRPTRNVQDRLRQNFRSRRERGMVPYPVKYSHSQRTYDTWNQMFLKTLAQEPGGITLHRFECPPKRVLDLGCGGGFWILEAATKHWKDTMFVGLDILDNQPDVLAMSKSAVVDQDLPDRIKWIKANFLDRLPFLNGSFDFVRICDLGLAVPEDEWQNLLQEVRRVLEPGGVVEILEEDLIFPTGQPPRSPTWPDTLLSANTPYRHSVTSPSTSSIVDNTFSLNSALGDDSHKMSQESSMYPPSFISEVQTLVRHDDTASKRTSDRDSTKSKLDPQNHGGLKEAWQNMLHRRFLAPRLTSVLPFYINSEFDDMSTHPSLFIGLPPNSERGVSYATKPWSTEHQSDSDPDLRTDVQDSNLRTSRDTNGSDEVSIMTRRSTITNQHAAMHLARTVNVIEGCKDAIYEEYAETARKKHPYLRQLPDASDTPGLVDPIRVEFEEAWTNWQNDMKDRMSLRGGMLSWLSWSPGPVVDERPEWRIWRDRVDSLDCDALSLSSGINGSDTDLCRSLRGFVAWKSMNDEEDSE